MRKFLAEWWLLILECLIILGISAYLTSCNFTIPKDITIHVDPGDEKNDPKDPTDPGEPPPDISFAKDIQPILKGSCFKCHNDGTSSGGLSVESYEGVMRDVRVGKPSIDSPLCARITSGSMPLGGPTLDSKTVNLICDWIDEGAKK